MRKSLLLIIFCLFLGVATSFAQNTLNIHQKNGGVVSYGFAEKPVLTYVDDNLHVSTERVSIDYPLAELEMLTFDDREASIGELRVEGQTAGMNIYRIDGTLVKRIEATAESSAFDTDRLPVGTYIVRQGNVTYKITKQ